MFKRKHQIESINGTGFVWKLEKAFESYLNGSHKSIAVSNATTGIMAILEILGLNSNDYLVCNAFGWGGTVAGAIKLNTNLIFADFDKRTLSISPESLDQILSKNNKVKVVIDVDFLGLPSRSFAVSQICKKHGVKHILDCACSFGTIHNNFPSGFYADFAVYSFNAQKNLATGEGGMICVKKNEDYYRLISFCQHPNRQKRDLPGLVDGNQFGMNYRIHPYSAFIAYNCFSKTLRQIKKRRNRIYKRFPLLKNYFGEDCSPNFNTILVNMNVLNRINPSKVKISSFPWKNHYLLCDKNLFSLTKKIKSYITDNPVLNLIMVTNV